MDIAIACGAGMTDVECELRDAMFATYMDTLPAGSTLHLASENHAWADDSVGKHHHHMKQHAVDWVHNNERFLGRDNGPPTRGHAIMTRNRELICFDLVAFWDRQDIETAELIVMAKAVGKLLRVYIIRERADEPSWSVTLEGGGRPPAKTQPRQRPKFTQQAPEKRSDIVTDEEIADYNDRRGFQPTLFGGGK